MSHDDFDFEPIRGLPKRLPPGERILWQGAPDASAFAYRFLRLPHLTGYFIALVAWVVASALLDGGSAREAVAAAGVKKGVLMKTLRAALLGSLQGPDLLTTWLLLQPSGEARGRIERSL